MEFTNRILGISRRLDNSALCHCLLVVNHRRTLNTSGKFNLLTSYCKRTLSSGSIVMIQFTNRVIVSSHTNGNILCAYRSICKSYTSSCNGLCLAYGAIDCNIISGKPRSSTKVLRNSKQRLKRLVIVNIHLDIVIQTPKFLSVRISNRSLVGRFINRKVLDKALVTYHLMSIDVKDFSRISLDEYEIL